VKRDVQKLDQFDRLGLCALGAGCNKADSLPVLTVYEVKGKMLLVDGKWQFPTQFSRHERRSAAGASWRGGMKGGRRPRPTLFARSSGSLSSRR
jgi:hypothetical protein